MTDPFLSHLLDSARHGLFLHDEEFRFISVNPAGAALLGYSREALLQMALSDIEPDFDRHGIRNRLMSLRNGERLQTTGKPRRSDGKAVAVEVMVTALETDNRRLYAVDVRPITTEPHPVEVHRLKDLATALLASLQELQLDRHEGKPPDVDVLEDLAGVAAALIVCANQATTPSVGWPDLAATLTQYQNRMKTLLNSPFSFTPPPHPVTVAVTEETLKETLNHLLSTATTAAALRGEELRCTLITTDFTASCRLSFGAPAQPSDLTVARQIISASGGEILLEDADLVVLLPLVT